MPRPNFTPEAADRLAQANAANAEKRRIYGQGPVGAVLAKGPNGEPYRVGDADVMARFLHSRPSTPEDWARFEEAVGGPDQARAIGREYIVRDLLDKGIVRDDGTVNLGKFATYRQGPRGRVIDHLGLTHQFDTAEMAQRALDETTAAAEKSVADYRNGVAKRFLGGTDPATAVREVLNSPNGTRQLQRLVDAVRADPDALRSLRGHVADWLADRFTTLNEIGPDAQADLTKAETFRNWIRANKQPLRTLYPGSGGQSLQTLEQVAAEIRRLRQIKPAAAGSPTASYFQQAAQHGMSKAEKGGVGAGLSVFGALLGERAAESAGTEGWAGLALGGVALPAATAIVQRMRAAGVETVKDALSFAMQHPQVARELAARVAPDGTIGPMAQRRIGAAIATAVAADTARPEGRKQ